MTRLDGLRILRFPDLVKLGIVNNRTTLRRWRNTKHDPFPKPLSLGNNSIGWRLVDVEAWLKRRKKR